MVMSEQERRRAVDEAALAAAGWCAGCDRVSVDIPPDEDCPMCPFWEGLQRAQTSLSAYEPYVFLADRDQIAVQNQANDLAAAGYWVAQYTVGYAYAQNQATGTGGPMHCAVIKLFEHNIEEHRAALTERNARRREWAVALINFREEQEQPTEEV